MTSTKLVVSEASSARKQKASSRESTRNSLGEDAVGRRPLACLNVCGFLGRMLRRDANVTSGSVVAQHDADEDDKNEAMLQRSREVESSLSGLVVIAPPQRFSDFFELGTVRGEGQFGTVFRAQTTKIGQSAFPWMQVGQTCAVKKTKNAFRKGQHLDEIHRSVLQLSPARSAEFFQNLTSEHAADNNIVLVHGQMIEPQSVHGGLNALVMEMLEGPDLHAYVAQQNTVMQEGNVASLMRQILTAVHYLHRVAGCYHRDIKPENFGFTQPVAGNGAFPTLKLFDFGTAWILPEPVTEATASDIIDLKAVGTFQWLAPEIFEKKCGAASDVWSVGLILHYLLIGDLPWNIGDCRNARGVARILKRRQALAFDMDTLDTTSAVALEFVSALLHRDPPNRASTSWALQHPWLKASSGSVPLSDLESTTEFRRQTSTQTYRTLGSVSSQSVMSSSNLFEDGLPCT